MRKLRRRRSRTGRKQVIGVLFPLVARPAHGPGSRPLSRRYAFRPRRPRRPVRDERRLADVLAEVKEQALPRGGCRTGVPGTALIAVAAMVGRVEMDLDLRMDLLERLHALDRDVRILIAEMRHRRHRGLARSSLPTFDLEQTQGVRLKAADRGAVSAGGA